MAHVKEPVAHHAVFFALTDIDMEALTPNGREVLKLDFR